LKQRKNVLIMATSNLVKAIGTFLPYSVQTSSLDFLNKMVDTAFLDRADIVQYVDLPSREAIYEILRSCLCEIVVRGIVSPVVCAILLFMGIFKFNFLFRMFQP